MVSVRQFPSHVAAIHADLAAQTDLNPQLLQEQSNAPRDREARVARALWARLGRRLVPWKVVQAPMGWTEEGMPVFLYRVAALTAEERAAYAGGGAGGEQGDGLGGSGFAPGSNKPSRSQVAEAEAAVDELLQRIAAVETATGDALCEAWV